MLEEQYKIEKDLIIISKDTLNDIKAKLEDMIGKIGMGNTFINISVAKGQIEIIDKIIELSKTEMAEIKDDTYISLSNNISEPYKKGLIIENIKEWNNKYSEDATCECGDPYYRHFDTYENMEAIGCKYCQCNYFKPKIVS